MYSRKNIKGIVLTLASAVLFVTCKKDKVPDPIPLPGPTKWEIIAGNYKVYDTLGEYLYDMNIVHVPCGVYNNNDSLRFENFDGEFVFTSVQTSFSNEPELLIRTGHHQLLYDSDMHRWNLMTAANDEYKYNVFHNDTINFIFRKTNINYYLVDNTPYFFGTCKQVAVKQH